jgi:hypothetical protein
MRQSFLARAAEIAHRERNWRVGAELLRSRDRPRALGSELMRPKPLSVRGVKPSIRTFSERVEEFIARLLPGWRLGMDGAFYLDTRAPFIGPTIAAVTLATTNKALYGLSNFPNIGGNYFSFVGKKIGIRLYGQITTGVTPGNGQFAVLYGTGADANGVVLVTSAADTLIASQTNASWDVEVFVRCVTTGNAGTLFCTGSGLYNSAVVAAHHSRLPASAPVVSGSCDLTANNVISIQYNRSGSTAETMQVVDMEVVAYN